jgi:hypothetical protein
MHRGFSLKTDQEIVFFRKLEEIGAIAPGHTCVSRTRDSAYRRRNCGKAAPFLNRS